VASPFGTILDMGCPALLAIFWREGGPLDINDIYDNGPTNGNTDAWTINFGFIVSDSFNVTQGNNTNVTGMSFAAWMAPGDVLDSAEVSITSSLVPQVRVLRLDANLGPGRS
jgi:hypothetical protein